MLYLAFKNEKLLHACGNYLLTYDTVLCVYTIRSYKGILLHVNDVAKSRTFADFKWSIIIKEVMLDANQGFENGNK